MLKRFRALPVLGLTAITLWLRFANLGYSDFQGDEIKALFLLEPGENLFEFLFTQRKGPIQFLITFLLKLVDPVYENRFLVRSPFAIAGALAVLFFYKLVKDNFGKKIAAYSSFFLTVNGFLVAFGRIVQYQSFVILFMTLALYMFSLSTKNEKWRIRGLYLGFIFWALSILSHYDGVFIAPFAAYFLFIWFKNCVLKKVSGKKMLKHLVFAALIGGIMLASFYVPFVASISDSTKSYWQGRLEGTGGKISSSKVLFQVYQPIYVIHIYTILFFTGLTGIIVKLKKKFSLKELSLLVWFLLAFLFFEVLVSIPGTHIYAYLVPAFVVLGFGISELEAIAGYIANKIHIVVKVVVGYLSKAAILVIFSFMFLQANAIFVNHSVEYPWTSEEFLIWEFHQPSPIFHLSMFGFPYYRYWDEISAFVTSTENNGFYSTNERKSISRYHIPFEKDTDSAGHFVYILNPQSFTPKPTQKKAQYYVDNVEPVKVFYASDTEDSDEKRAVAKVYYMKEGPIELILEGENSAKTF